MKELWILLLIPVGILLQYMLYQHGFAVMSNKRALTYIGRDRCRRADFTACSGTVKRMLRVKESRVYRFSADISLSKGELSIELLAPDKTALLVLNEKTPQAQVELEAGKSYGLVFRYRSANGSYTLDWE